MLEVLPVIWLQKEKSYYHLLILGSGTLSFLNKQEMVLSTKKDI